MKKLTWMVILVSGLTIVGSAGAEVLLWEPFDYAADLHLSGLAPAVPGGEGWYRAAYNWAGMEGYIANDAVLDAGNYLKNTSQFNGVASGYEMHLANRALAANEMAELTFTLRREAGNTAPEVYLYALLGGWDHGGQTGPPKGWRYAISPQDSSWAPAGGNWWMQALSLDDVPGTILTTNVPISGLGSIVDVKIALAQDYVAFYCRNHGSAEWNLLATMVGKGATSVQKVTLALYSEGTAADGYDSVKLEIVPYVPPPVPVVTVQGTVVLGDYLGDPSVPVAVKVELRQLGIPMVTVQKILDVNGQFTIGSVAQGTYDVAVKSYGHLQKVLSGVTVSDTETDLGLFELTGGDGDGDNEVTTSDLATVLLNMDQVGD